MPQQRATIRGEKHVAFFTQLQVRDDAERKAISIIVFDYSILAQTTDMGTRSFSIAAGLSQLSSELREIVLEIVRQS